MEEIQQDYSRAAADPEATAVQPRFDALEAQTAQPVVPLSRAAAWRHAWRQRRLSVALVLVSALVGGLVSVFAYRLYQRAAQHTSQQPASVAPQPTPSPELTAAAPTNDGAGTAATEHQAATAREAATHDAAAHANPPSEAPTERASRPAQAEAPRPHSEAPTVAHAPREERRAVGESERVRREPPRAVRVDVITSPEATERVVRRHGDDDEPRDERRARRVKGRNIDRIRDIFGAPPPA